MPIFASIIATIGLILSGWIYSHPAVQNVGASQSISSLTELTSLSHNDVLPITEANGLTTKKVKWGTATSSMKAVFDPLYSPIAGSASLVTLGNVTTGTWNADTLTVAKGGTGSTSLIAYQLLAGNGTGAVTTFGNGISGYVLTSNGAGALPSFQNVGVTTGNNNTWTGTNTFTATSTFSAPTFGANVYAQYLASTTITGATTPVAVFVATSTNALWKTDASIATTSDFLGFAISNATNGVTTTVQIDGVVNGLSGLTPGQAYYASTTGVLSSVYNVGTAEIYVGRAVSTTQLLLDRKGEGWQYLGSATCSNPSGSTSGVCYATAPLFARFAQVNADVYSSACIGGSGHTPITLMIIKTGLAASTIQSVTPCDVGHNNSGFRTASAVFSATSSVIITLSSDSSLNAQTQTVYFYR